MALTTQSIPEKPTEKSNHEGYEFIRDEEGRLSLKKIRSEKPLKKVVKKVEKVKSSKEE